jgi:hypothetical protein
MIESNWVADQGIIADRTKEMFAERAILEGVMKQDILAVAAAACLFAACPALAAGTNAGGNPGSSPSSPATPATDTGNQDEVICHREKLTGSMLPGPRVCKPRKLWDAQHENSEDLVNGTTMKQLQFSPPGG